MAQLNSLLVTGNSRFLNPINGNARNGVYQVIGTQTAATGAWTGTIPVPALYDGLTIIYYLPYAGSGNATLNLTLSDGTTTGAINCYYRKTERLTTHFPSGSSIVLTYHPAGSIKYDGTATTDNRWVANANYLDGNDQAYCDRICSVRATAGSNKIFPYTLVMRLPDGRWESIVTSASTATSKARNTHGFLFGQIAWMNYNETYNENALISDYRLWSRYTYNVDYRYFCNVDNNSTYGLTANKPVYLVGSISSDGLFYLDATWWTQTLPSTENGKIYIYIGDAYDYYRASFYGTGNIQAYVYTNGHLREFHQDAATVGGHTVAKDVPSNADFSNTTYTLGTSGNNVTLTPSSGSAQSITAPYATSAGSASSATTASKLGSSTVGSVNRPIYLSNGTPSVISWYMDSCTISGGNTANYPWHRFAYTTTTANTYTDKSVIIVINSRFNSGYYGVIKLSTRTNAVGAEKQATAVWLTRYGFAVDDVIISKPAQMSGTDETISAYVKCTPWPRRIAYMLEGSNNGWTIVSSREADNTTASDPKDSVEVYASVSNTNNAYDGTTVNYANSAGSASSATSATKATYLDGFSSAESSQTWGNQTGTFIHGESDTTGGSIAFRRDNPSNGQCSMILDGTVYIKEGVQNVGDAIKSITRSGTTFTYTTLWGNTGTFTQQDNNTTYTFTGGTNKFTVTPSGGTAQDVTITPSITNNVTGSGTSGYLTKFNGANTITNGPQLGSSTTTYLRNDGSWQTPPNDNNAVTQTITSNDAEYRLLFSGTADSTTRTEGVRKSSNLVYNPDSEEPILYLLDGSFRMTYGGSGPAIDRTPILNIFPMSSPHSTYAIVNFNDTDGNNYAYLDNGTFALYNTEGGESEIICDRLSSRDISLTYNASKSSGKWSIYEVIAQRSGNTVTLGIVLYGDGTSVASGSNGFVGTISNGPVVSSTVGSVTLVGFVTGTPMMGALDSEGNLTVRPCGSAITLASTSRAKITATFVVD